MLSQCYPQIEFSPPNNMTPDWINWVALNPQLDNRNTSSELWIQSLAEFASDWDETGKGEVG